MKKVIILFLSALFLVSISAKPVFGQDQTPESIDLQIHTKLEGGEIVEGTDGIELDIYDLTKWRLSNKASEKEAKEFLRDTYVTKAEVQNFVKEQQLKMVNATPVTLDADGVATISVPRYQDGQDAAYLILATGETGKQQLMPIVLYLPQVDPQTNEESRRLLIYGKYSDLPTESSTVDSSTSESSNVPIVDDDGYSETNAKSYPQTNEMVTSCLLLGGLLLLIAIITFRRQERKNRGE